MAELSFDIVARTGQVNRQLAQTENAIENLGNSAQRAGKQVQGNFTPFVFQAGQALSDFSVAGVLGAANNIEFLVAQFGQLRKTAGGTSAFFKGLLSTLAGPSGILFAVSAASAAFFAFGDDIKRALSGASTDVKELKEGIDEVLNFIDNDSSTLFLFEDQLPAAIEDAKNQIEELKALQAENATTTVVGGAGGAVTVVTVDPKFADDIKEVETLLDRLNEKQKEYNRNSKAGSATLTNALVEQNRLGAEAIRIGIEELGLSKELGKISDERLLQIAREGELTEFINDLQERRNKNRKEELDAFQKIQKANEDLRTELNTLKQIDRDRLGLLLLQNEVVERQIKNIKEQARIAAFLDEIDLMPSPAVPVFGREDLDADPAAGGGPLGLPSDLEKTIAEMEYLDIATKEVIDSSKELTSVVRFGITDAFTSFFSAIGSGGDPFAALRVSVGSFAVDLGKTFIAFGVAGESIKQFARANPIAAIGAGAALITLGSALKRSAESKAAAFGTSGTVQSGVPGVVAPNQGRAPGLLNTNPNTPEREPFQQVLFITGELLGRGEDLVAVVDTTNRRIGRTRGS